MSFNLSEFKAQIANRGLAKSNLAMARITLPSTMKFLEQNISTRELTFLCKTMSLPELSFTTQEIRPYGFGKIEHRPSDFAHGQLNSIFMMDSEFGTMKFFQRWMQGVMNYNTYDGHDQEDPQGKLPYEFAYKEDYAATVELLIYSGNDASKVYYYTFGNAFPVTLGQIDIDWANDAEVMTLPVGFEYDKFKVQALELGQVRPLTNGNNGFLSYISAINGFGQAINQLQRPTNIQDAINQITNVNTIFNAL